VVTGFEALSHALASTPVRVGVFGALALLLTWPALGTAGSMNFFRDAQVLMPYEDHAVDTVRLFAQVPLWDPFYCGGIFSLGTPQSRFASPTFLLSLLFGTLRAEAITVFVMIWIGLEGMFRYARSRGASALGAALAAPVFAASGNFATSFFHGWINFYGFELLPWAMFGVREAASGNRRAVVVAACSLAWIVGFGGTYAAPMAALLCAFEALEALASRGRRPTEALIALGSITTIATLGIGLAALRTLPVIETVAASERLLADRPGLPLDAVHRSLFGSLSFAGNNLASLDGAFFVGIAAIPVALVGALRLRSLSLVGLGATCLWAATGYAHGWSPFVGLRALPAFSVLRYPERYLIVVALVLSVLAAWGITRAESAMRKHVGWALLLVALSVTLVINFVAMVPRHHEPISHMDLVEPPPRVERDFHQARGTRWALAYYGPMSRGCLSCWDAYPVPQSPLLRADLPHEEYLVEGAQGSVQRTRWTPNRIDLSVDLASQARLRVNQNWHPGWRTSVGSVLSDNGLLAVDLPAGRHDLTLRFLPRSVIAGGLASLAALVVLGLMVRRRRDQQAGGREVRWHLLLSLAPFALVGATYGVLHEPAVELPSPLTPSGEAVVVDRLPEGAVPLDVHFARGVSLVGARVEPTVLSPGQDLTLEIAWVVDDEVPRDAGVFVHVRGESGGMFQLDHTRLSGAFELAAAPKGKTLRDVVVHRLPANLARERWTVWVGVWHALGDGSRLPVAAGGDARVEANAVEVGSFVVR
jgi:hypothetical protein